jgi:hypothetical protein
MLKHFKDHMAREKMRMKAHHHGNHADMHRDANNETEYEKHYTLSQYFHNKADDMMPKIGMMPPKDMEKMKKKHTKDKAEFNKHVEDKYPENVK